MAKEEITVPEGLRELLQDFTVCVLRDKPVDLLDFAAHYFTMKKAEENNLLDDDLDEPPMPPPPRSGARRAGVAAESYDPEKEEVMEKVVHPKTEEQRQRLQNATSDILLFRCLDDDQMQEVIDAMFERKVSAGEQVITYNEDGDNFYVIESGIYDIITKDGKTVGQYDNKGSFGELALMYNTPRAATITATVDGVVWAMTREVFRGIVVKKASEKRRMYEEILDKVPILQSLSTYERMSIADALRTRIFEDDQPIICQGDPGKEMFFVEDGEVRINMRKPGADSETELTRLKKGGYFGELALLTKQPRAASVYAVGRSKCAVLDVESFERLLGPCVDILKRNISDYETKLKEIFGDGSQIPELRG